MKNNCLEHDGIMTEMWKHFSKNKEGMGITMGIFINILGGKAYPKKWKMVTA
jgi:hypothetical protein